jgi:two-component system OmpR family sensor kinase
VKGDLKTTDIFRWWQSRPPAPLRLWLRSSTVLAVLAGYSLLVLLNLSLARLERRRAHQQLVESLRGELARRVRTASEAPELIRALLLPGLQVDLIAASAAQRPGADTPRLRWQRDRALIESISPIWLADGSQRALRMRQDVTESIASQRLTVQLLIAAAGGAALFTSLLMRPVLNRGLVRPLRALGEQLDTYRLPPAAPVPLDLEALPEELRPIAASFNAMQQDLAASWERQRSFVDGVAHELRTPITLISGHAQRLERSGASGAAGHSLRLISAEARRMGALVSDMLDLARQDAGRLELRTQPIDTEDLLLDVYERLAPGTKGRLRIDLPIGIGVEALELPPAAGDPRRVEQCLTTLVENACRYAPEGPISLVVEVTRDALLLHVRDHGPGVREGERETIFERFVRGSASVDKRGSGIGLSVAQSLMRAMGGRISVVSTTGGGADFRLHLPRWQAREQADSRSTRQG